MFVLLKWLEQAYRFDATLVKHFSDEVSESFVLFCWRWADLKSVADGSEILDSHRFISGAKKTGCPGSFVSADNDGCFTMGN